MPINFQYIVLFAGLMLHLAPLTTKAAPSYDCKKASGQVEQTICKNTELQDLDNKLHDAYQTVLKQLSSKEESLLRAWQRGWIKGRNACWKSQSLVQCIEHHYKTRITELQIQGGTIKPPKPVIFQCQNQRLTVYFYNDTEVPAAVINEFKGKLPDEQVFTALTRSASGAKYQGKNVSFWVKGTEATLKRYGKPDEKCYTID